MIRFRSRHLHATLVTQLRAGLTDLGWVTPPINFSTTTAVVLDYQPDERGQPISSNTVAISLADFGYDIDEELGALGGGLRSAPYGVYVDVYMAEQALSIAICDDIRDVFTDETYDLIDQITAQPVLGCAIEIERVVGPERPPAALGAEQFKKNWRVMRVDTRLYFPS